MSASELSPPPVASPLTGLASLPLDAFAAPLASLSDEELDAHSKRLGKANPRTLTGVKHYFYHSRFAPLLTLLAGLAFVFALPYVMPDSLNFLAFGALVLLCVYGARLLKTGRLSNGGVASPLELRAEHFKSKTSAALTLDFKGEATAVRELANLPKGEDRQWLSPSVTVTPEGGAALTFGCYNYWADAKKQTRRAVDFVFFPFAEERDALPYMRVGPRHREPLSTFQLSAAFGREYSVVLDEDSPEHRLQATRVFAPDVQELLVRLGGLRGFGIAVGPEGVLVTGHFSFQELLQASPSQRVACRESVLLSALLAQEVLEQIDPVYKTVEADKTPATALLKA